RPYLIQEAEFDILASIRIQVELEWVLFFPVRVSKSSLGFFLGFLHGFRNVTHKHASLALCLAVSNGPIRARGGNRFCRFLRNFFKGTHADTSFSRLGIDLF